MDNSEVLTQLAALQSQLATQKLDRKGLSIWVVFNPKQVGVWCEKSGCPVTGRRSKLETVRLRKSQTMSAFLTDDNATQEDIEEEDEIEHDNVEEDEIEHDMEEEDHLQMAKDKSDSIEEIFGDEEFQQEIADDWEYDPDNPNPEHFS